MRVPESQAPIRGPLPFGLMRLGDMIDYQCFALVHLLRMVREGEEIWGRTANAEPHTFVTDQGIAQVRSWFPILRQESLRLEMDPVAHRLDMFEQQMRTRITNEALCTELRVLRETIEGELNFKYFYHYPRREAQRLLKVTADWSEAFQRFPSCQRDAEAAVDAWALKDGTGCVFHCMRIAEIGLRALARERKVKLSKDRPLEYAQWQEVIKATEAEAEKAANWPAKRARARDRATTFYRGVLGELHAFKEVRNGVMHARSQFDQQQAESVLNHVQGFMRRLAERLDETSNAPIRWGR